jgi:hypothetical protein
MLEEMIKRQIEVYLIENGLKDVVNNIVEEKLSDENIKKTVEAEIDKLLPEAISKSIKYQIEESDAIYNIIDSKLKDFIYYKYIKKVINKSKKGLINQDKAFRLFGTLDNWEMEADLMFITKKNKLISFLEEI